MPTNEKPKHSKISPVALAVALGKYFEANWLGAGAPRIPSELQDPNGGARWVATLDQRERVVRLYETLDAFGPDKQTVEYELPMEWFESLLGPPMRRVEYRQEPNQRGEAVGVRVPVGAA